MSETIRYFLKHRAEPATYAVEGDDDGTLRGALDVTATVTAGGLCAHQLATLPIEPSEDLERLQAARDDFEEWVPDCENVHHLMTELLALERAHLASINTYAAADAQTKALKKTMEAAGTKVHALLQKVADRKPLPLLDAAGV